MRPPTAFSAFQTHFPARLTAQPVLCFQFTRPVRGFLAQNRPKRINNTCQNQETGALFFLSARRQDVFLPMLLLLLVTQLPTLVALKMPAWTAFADWFMQLPLS